MTTQSQLMSLEEFEALPETEPYTELIDGVREQKPVGKQRHSIAQSNLGFLLRLHGATAKGRVLPEQGFRFPKSTSGNLRVPDLSYYLPENRPAVDEDYPERAPDLAAEVRSRGQRIEALRERLAFLRAQGTRATLLIDPDARTVEVHDGERDFTAGTGESVLVESLGGFGFKVAELFE